MTTNTEYVYVVLDNSETEISVFANPGDADEHKTNMRGNHVVEEHLVIGRKEIEQNERTAVIKYLRKLKEEASGSSLSTQIEKVIYRHLIEEIEQGKHLDKRTKRIA